MGPNDKASNIKQPVESEFKALPEGTALIYMCTLFY